MCILERFSSPEKSAIAILVMATIIVIVSLRCPVTVRQSHCCIPVRSSGMAHSTYQYETPAGETATLKIYTE
ncbi:uncharacterized protein ASPGLDRAFT_681046 [Aspergillus glaucus CBS 516.65]|uniref:Uncharacterized protein n=1 Tax=Aspergillus glaucus CBS 516.65 TaxID=1160497 RepID=A0A1L9VWF0_ASPGL|nr:hypothetical protein ASPGLDRAFT_681046 [Aspergillus glaucus CBS 516.65]OJJ88234.1 hypothetical protein ASPGLDRAFT_681046 [Aspergillus glaucus CBS 516.65]